MFVVLKEIHSSSGNLKNVNEESIELDKDLTAEGKTLSYLFLNSLKNPTALSLEEA